MLDSIEGGDVSLVSSVSEAALAAALGGLPTLLLILHIYL
jgi:hypothetical protein